MNCIIADAGPITALSKSHSLGLLQSLFEQVVITDSVLKELDSSKDETLAAVNAAIVQGWLVSVIVPITDPELAKMLDPGEVSSILYSLDHNRIPLLIDEYKGKQWAKKQDIPVIGTAGILIKAKQMKLIPLVKPLLLDMQSKGYWLSNQFINTVACMVDED